jgi:hypothetical protein
MKYMTLILLLIITSSPCCAASKSYSDNLYQIEVIVFSKITKTAINAENWPQLINANKWGINRPAVTLAQLNNMSYQPVDNATPTLNTMVKSLEKNHYTVLYHRAWQQVISKNQLQNYPTYIQGGRLFEPDGSLVNNPNQVDDTGHSIAELNGTMSIKLDRYFDVKLNLILSEPKQNIDTIDDSSRTTLAAQDSDLYKFRLLQESRSRSNEINYIDNPLLGVLYKITKA